MMTRNKKITVVSNVALVLIFAVVFCVSYFAQTPIPIYGGKEISAIYNGDRNGKKVSLMFNVYENADVVNGILDVLKLNEVSATFFVGGCWADDNEQTLKRIVAEGNEIANHGYFHKDHKTLNYEKNKREIENTGAVITALTGVNATLFAPPSGSFSSTTLECAYDLGYKVIMWSKDTIDWRDNDKSKIFSRATKNMMGGDLILMHPKKHTLDCLQEIIDFGKLNGFTLTTVSNNVLQMTA